jgi:hypothetical protein
MPLRFLLRALAAFVCILPGAAVAQSSEPACEAVAVDAARFGSTTVYRECAVEKKAKLRKDVDPDFTLSSGTITCLTAKVEMMVDAAGRVNPTTARVLGTNFEPFGEALVNVLEKWRFEPAEIEKQKVAQLTLVEHSQRATDGMGRKQYTVSAMDGTSRSPLIGKPVGQSANRCVPT